MQQGNSSFTHEIENYIRLDHFHVGISRSFKIKQEINSNPRLVSLTAFHYFSGLVLALFPFEGEKPLTLVTFLAECSQLYVLVF